MMKPYKATKFLSHTVFPIDKDNFIIVNVNTGYSVIFTKNGVGLWNRDKGGVLEALNVTINEFDSDCNFYKDNYKEYKKRWREANVKTI